MKKFLVLIFVLFLFPDLSFGKIPSTTTDHASIEILAESKEIKIGENFVLGIKFDLDPGWHTYWKNPGDSGLPPDIKWSTPKGINQSAKLWPVPGRAEVEPLMSYGYYDQLVLPIIFNIDEDFDGEQEFSVEIDFLICSLPTYLSKVVGLNFSTSKLCSFITIIYDYLFVFPNISA